MILIDYNNVAIANTSVQLRIGNLDGQVSFEFLLNKLREYNLRFKDKYGELVVCADHPIVWRKAFFPHYKARRAGKRSKDPLDDFNRIADVSNEFLNILKTKSPYKVIQTNHAEGDDVVSILSRQPGKHVVISADKDLTMLKSDNVDVFNPLKKQFVDNGSLFRLSLVVSGDPDDDVPNILSDDDCFVDPDKRQKPLRANVKEHLYDTVKRLPHGKFDITHAFNPQSFPLVKGIEVDQIRKNFERNDKLINLSRIPLILVDRVNDDFLNAEYNDVDLINFTIACKTSPTNLSQLVPNKMIDYNNSLSV